MAEKQIIAVTGATGAQGGGLARAILDEPDSAFTVRAITRNPGSDAARELARRGAEVVQADMDDEASLAKAFDGAYGAFLVTNFWEHMDPEREAAQARNLVGAAKAANIAHAIWSTLEDFRETFPLDDDRIPTLDGKYKVPHCDVKGEADAWFTEAGVPTTFLRTSFYFDNFLSSIPLRRQDDGTLVLPLALGEAALAGIAVEDIGRSALGVFKRGRELLGQTIAVAAEHLTGDQYAQVFTNVLGEPVAYAPFPYQALRDPGIPGGAELANMFQVYAEFSESLLAQRNPAVLRGLVPSPQSFKDWLITHKDAFASL
ncbi:NmrA/HSCARG family protein [Glycomyces sp. NPDC021274]|uniref:NmrA/HSCARG family protein n=1 Tax=Glycomyces sp. NPDC021274 TaxID=3155120 RepID=UPI0033C8DBAF